MPDLEPTTARRKPRSNSWQSGITVVQEVEPPFIPAGAHATTIVIEYPPGHPGSPPHRHSGPIFGYVLEGEMVFELEGEPPRVIRAGEAFWEPGGDVIAYQDGNFRDICMVTAATPTPTAIEAASASHRAELPAAAAAPSPRPERADSIRGRRGA